MGNLDSIYRDHLGQLID